MGVRDIKDHSSQKKDEKWGLSLHFLHFILQDRGHLNTEVVFETVFTHLHRDIKGKGIQKDN
jgi:hypothetical protein